MESQMKRVLDITILVEAEVPYPQNPDDVLQKIEEALNPHIIGDVEFEHVVFNWKKVCDRQ